LTKGGKAFLDEKETHEGKATEIDNELNAEKMGRQIMERNIVSLMTTTNAYDDASH
jgi:hypothetical protein